MKRTTIQQFFAGLIIALPTSAWASDAATSATAGSNLLQRNGTAAATARYEGDRGFARTDTQSGPLNRARGVAVGVDEDGLSLSVSHAIAPRQGPAVATNFSLTIDRDGDVARSRSVSVARAPLSREVTASGATGTGARGAHAIGTAGGKTDPYGVVEARSDSQVDNARELRPLRAVKKVLR